MKKRVLGLMLVAILLLSSCNLPTTPEEPSIPPLEQTLTALYATASAIPATKTPQPQPPTATVTSQVVAAPTNTQAVAPTNPPATAAPAATSQPPTATRPPYRTSVSVEAANITPTIDGDWTEWKGKGKEYPARNVVYGKSNRVDEADSGLSYYVGWDANNLYIAVKVGDDKYVQEATGENIYKGDSIELLIDTDLQGDFFVQSLNSDDYQIGLSPGRPDTSGTREAYRWYPSGKAGALTNVTIGSVSSSGIWRLEAAIPWSVLGITPYKGMHLGFAISVSDNDNPGTQQESMVSNAPGRMLTDPTTWGDLVLK